jgi:MoxR-like ATPase
VSTATEIVEVVEAAKRIYVEESLNRYVVALLRHTRADERLYLGASPRSGIALLRVAKARALLDAREYLVPDDVKAVAEPVLAHRLLVAPEARSVGLSAADLVREALERTPVPV